MSPRLLKFRRLLIALLFFLIMILSILSPPAAEGKTVEKQFILDNGLKIFLYERHNLPLLNIVAAVNAGSKDETEETNGLVHLLEHYVLFRGTEIRSGSEIARDIRRHGAYFNAHTGQDLAVFEIALPSEYSDFALNNQKEILFSLKIDPQELEAEKEVVLEELNQIQDDPFKYALALVYQNLFSGHPYGRPVFGKAENIRALTAEQVIAFYKKFFVPSNCALAIVGDFSIREMEDKVRACFGVVKKEEFMPAKFEKAPPLSKTLELERTLDVKEAYLVIGTNAPDYNSLEQFAADVLTEILGRGISPMLYRPLKGERDLINTASMGFMSLKYGGAFSIYLTLDPKHLKAAKNKALQFLRRSRNENFSKDDVTGEEKMYAFDFLQAAKNQINFYSQQAQENGLALTRSLAMYLLLNENTGKIDFLENIKKITSSDVRKTAAKYLGKGEYVIVSIAPKKK